MPCIGVAACEPGGEGGGEGGGGPPVVGAAAAAAVACAASYAASTSLASSTCSRKARAPAAASGGARRSSSSASSISSSIPVILPAWRPGGIMSGGRGGGEGSRLWSTTRHASGVTMTPQAKPRSAHLRVVEVLDDGVDPLAKRRVALVLLHGLERRSRQCGWPLSLQLGGGGTQTSLGRVGSSDARGDGAHGRQRLGSVRQRAGGTQAEHTLEHRARAAEHTGFGGWRAGRSSGGLRVTRCVHPAGQSLALEHLCE
eukprot:scaffold3945_cov105-Isochrysis_galbana.AAC.12